MKNQFSQQATHTFHCNYSSWKSLKLWAHWNLGFTAVPVRRYIEHLHIWEEKLSAASLLCRTGRIKRLPNWTGETFALTPMLCTPAMKIYEIMGRNGLPNRGAAEFVEILIVTSSHHICNTGWGGEVVRWWGPVWRPWSGLDLLQEFLMHYGTAIDLT